MFIILTFMSSVYLLFMSLGDISLSDATVDRELSLACYDMIGPRKGLTSEIVSREFEKGRVEPHAKPISRPRRFER